MLISSNEPEQRAMAPWPLHWEICAGIRYLGLQQGNGNVLGFGVSERVAGKGHRRVNGTLQGQGTRSWENGGDQLSASRACGH